MVAKPNFWSDKVGYYLPRFKFPHLTRGNQLVFLVVAAAVSAAAQYVVQGTMASGGDPAKFSATFWTVDYFLWGFRALIEAWVIIYLFMTIGGNWIQKTILTMLEVALIVLIFLTLGPALFSLVIKQPITVAFEQLLGSWGLPGLLIWTFVPESGC